jgi:hypothetical protein
LSTKRERRYWTPEEDAILRELYPNHATSIVAERTGKSIGSLHQHAALLGIRKTKEWMRQHSRDQAKNLTAGRFLKGRPPWNKGMKGMATGGQATRFKPGNRPHTWVPIGTERISKDGYLERKVTDDGPVWLRFKGVQIIVWEAVNGPVPKGHAVVFRDGDKRNITIENLELVSRAELMRRNSVHRYPPAIKAAITAKARLTRMINELERNHEEQTD